MGWAYRGEYAPRLHLQNARDEDMHGAEVERDTVLDEVGGPRRVRWIGVRERSEREQCADERHGDRCTRPHKVRVANFTQRVKLRS